MNGATVNPGTGILCSTGKRKIVVLKLINEDIIL
ncbi:MAG: hypothetical protein JWR18_3468 [Segetibacter sp.]|jgi:hypothetical protein|nr:hypothetical protein [Segetibacter sp.]